MGTNTFHLLVAHWPTGGPPRVLARDKVFVRIGRGGISRGELTPDAFERALAALDRFRRQLDTLGVPPERALVTATSAVRSAANGHALVAAIARHTGLRVRVIDGHEEATYIYRGVREAVDLGHDTWLIMDIGGGSVEFIIATRERVHWQQSFEVGAQRLLDAFVTTDPMAPEAVARLTRYLDEKLAPLTGAVARFRPTALAGASGTFDTFVDMQAHADQRAADWDHQTAFDLPADACRRFHRQLLAGDRATRLTLPGMVEARVDMIVVASCLIDFVLSRYGPSRIRVSAYALKEGLLATAVGRYPAVG